MSSLWASNIPEFSQGDFERIQLFRSQYDKLYFDKVEPHFTLVFPDYDRSVARDQFRSHVRETVERFAPFDVALTETAIVEDHRHTHWDLFLVPAKESNGYKQLTALHDALYDGPLRPLLRKEIPYLPHVGIGNSQYREECVALASAASRLLPIYIKVTSVTVSCYDGISNEFVDKFLLKGV